jgi:hypothetical protein
MGQLTGKWTEHLQTYGNVPGWWKLLHVTKPDLQNQRFCLVVYVHYVNAPSMTSAVHSQHSCPEQSWEVQASYDFLVVNYCIRQEP